jgi:hypothetical protein
MLPDEAYLRSGALSWQNQYFHLAEGCQITRKEPKTTDLLHYAARACLDKWTFAREPIMLTSNCLLVAIWQKAKLIFSRVAMAIYRQGRSDLPPIAPASKPAF